MSPKNTQHVVRGPHDTSEPDCSNTCGLFGELSKMSQGLLETLSSSSQSLDKSTSKLSSIPLEITSVEQLKAAIAAVVEVVQTQQEANQRTQESVNQMVSKLLDENKSLQKDALTGLLNRHSFNSEFEKHLYLLRSEKEPFCLTLIDVDHFKNINDKFTHDGGDQALVFLAKALRKVFREQEVFRFGGEEFVVLISGKNSEVLSRVDYVLKFLNMNDFQYEENSIKMTFSAGVTQAVPTDLPEVIIKRADELMYKAKRIGRNRIVYDQM